MSETGAPGPKAGSWEPGTTVGPYLLMAPLAEGGMAEIWLARQSGPKGFERLVVIKRMMDALQSDPEHVEMFLTEARLAAQLTHPNVVQVFDLGEESASLYLVMEYLDGENLSVVRRMAVKHQQPLPEPYAVKLLAWAAEGLSYAHGRTGVDGKPLGIVHRDISPQNLFATFDGSLKVLDFGVAKLASQNTQSGRLKGKLGYMSPEQARGEVVDARSDLFSLGIVLFEQLTQSRLLPKLDDAETLGAIAHGKLPRPSERRPDLDRDLELIILKAMAPDREQRYQTARELQNALEGWLSQRGHLVTSSDVADYLRTLFARRIHDRRLLIEAAMRADLTPSSAQRMQRLARTATTSAVTSRHGKPKRSVVPLVVGTVLGAIAVAGVLVGTLRTQAAFTAPPVVVMPPPKSPGVLVVNTIPPGAQVSLDGALAGVAPVLLERLTEGAHVLEATLDGHQPTTRDVSAPAPGERVMLELALVPVPPPPAPVEAPPPPVVDKPRPVAARPRPVAMGRLTLKTTPWTSVFLGGKKLGDTPLVDLPVPAGTHVLKLSNPETGLESSIEVEVRAGQTTKKTLRL